MLKKYLLLLITTFSLSSFSENLLRIGVEAAYPPFSAVNEKGEYIGFDIDIAKALCKDMQVTCKLIKIDWDGLIPSLMNEQIDAIVASMTATEERKKKYRFYR